MDADEDTFRIRILSVSDTGRRRQWTVDEKIRIVRESRHDGVTLVVVTLADVARRHEISRSKLCDWRDRHKPGLPRVGVPFMRLMPMDIDRGLGVDAFVVAPPSAAMTIDLGAQYRVTITADFDNEAATWLRNGLILSR